MSAIFPRWTNSVPTILAVGSLGGAAIAAGSVWYWFTPSYWEVGYEPIQPVEYSHQTHVGKLGMDCRYCHTGVEESSEANIPATATCMNCHTGEGDVAMLNSDLWQAHKIDPNLLQVRTAFATGEPVQWRRVHKLPGYVQFNHAAHVRVGVSCYSCHGRVDQFAVVRQEKSLAMGWCLDCHRDPEPHLLENRDSMRDSAGFCEVTDLARAAELLSMAEQRERGKALANERNIFPPESCGACHN